MFRYDSIYSVPCSLFVAYFFYLCTIALSLFLTIKFYLQSFACCPVWTLASGVVRTGSDCVHARVACLCNTLQREPVKEHTVQGTLYRGSVNTWLLLASHTFPPYISNLRFAQNPINMCAHFTLLKIQIDKDDKYFLHLKPSWKFMV